MKAEKDKIYAQIIDGKCHWKFTVNELPEWKDDAFLVVDITGQDVQEGDIYDEATGAFIEPEVQVKSNEEDYTQIRDERLETYKNEIYSEATGEEDYAKIKAKRLEAYRNESDPIFFKLQRGEDGLTFADWIRKVEEIRSRYPYPAVNDNKEINNEHPNQGDNDAKVTTKARDN